jgi:hypothetical protein
MADKVLEHCSTKLSFYTVKSYCYRESNEDLLKISLERLDYYDGELMLILTNLTYLRIWITSVRKSLFFMKRMVGITTSPKPNPTLITLTFGKEELRIGNTGLVRESDGEWITQLYFLLELFPIG